MREKKAYFKRLDIIRDVSFIMVLLYHLNILKGGFLAVCTFFALSGYLECTSALKNKDFSIKLFYKNKLKRIYFPLIMVVFITVIYTKIVPSANWINLKKETISVIFGYNNFWQLKANLDYFTRNVSSPFIHLWYISILMQFYLIFPITFKILKKINKKIHVSLIIVIITTIATTILFYYMSKTQNMMSVYYNTLARSFSILVGILFAIIHYKHNFMISKKIEKYNKHIFNVYILLLILLCIFTSAQTKQYAFFMILVTIISVRLIVYSIKENTKKSVWDEPIKALATLTYEGYLVQYPIIFFMQNVSMNIILKNVFICVLTIIIAFMLHLMINIILKTNKFKWIKILFFGIIFIIGSFIVITEKDYTVEMKELESRLNTNLEVTQEKNNNYMNLVKAKEEEKMQKEELEKKEKKEKELKELLANIEAEKDGIEEEIKSLPVVGIGDSVLLGCIDEFYKVFPNGYFDGKVSRTILGAEDVINKLKSKGKLADTLIFSLANNGDYSDKINKGLMEIVGDREIYWVNAVGADDPKFNERFTEFAKDYHNIHIVEWDKAAQGHPEYLYADGVHIKGVGIKTYVDTIYKTIYNTYLEKIEAKKQKLIQEKNSSENSNNNL